MDRKSDVESEVRSDEEILEELGRRIAIARLDRDVTQAELAEEAGVSTATVKRLEAGHSTQLANLVRILRALGLADGIDRLAPAPDVRPMDRVRGTPPRRRASGRSRETDAGWTWGEDR